MIELKETLTTETIKAFNEGFNKGREEERNKISEIMSKGSDALESLFLITQYLVQERMKEQE